MRQCFSSNSLFIVMKKTLTKGNNLYISTAKIFKTIWTYSRIHKLINNNID